MFLGARPWTLAAFSRAPGSKRERREMDSPNLRGVRVPGTHEARAQAGGDMCGLCIALRGSFCATGIVCMLHRRHGRAWHDGHVHPRAERCFFLPLMWSPAVMIKLSRPHPLCNQQRECGRILTEASGGRTMALGRYCASFPPLGVRDELKSIYRVMISAQEPHRAR